VDHVTQPVSLAAPNEHLLAEHEIAPPVEIDFESAGNTIQSWILLPPGAPAGARFPLLLDIQDAPRRMCGPAFDLRRQILAAAGFAVLCVNSRGTPGYGEQFGALLRSRLPGDDFDDLMRGVDAALAKGFGDPSRLYVSGGLLAAWAIGHTGRFQRAVARRPVADWTADVATAADGLTRALNWMGGFPWDDPDQYVKHSPIYFAANFRTPTLVLAGENEVESRELYFAAGILELQATLAWLKR